MLPFLSVVNPGFKRKREGIWGEEKELEVSMWGALDEKGQANRCTCCPSLPDFLVGPSGKPAIKLGERATTECDQKSGDKRMVIIHAGN